jgi:adsorption protein B
MEAVFGGIDVAMLEATLFAACGFLLLGASDLAVDLIWIARTAWRRCTVYRRFERACAETLPPPERPGSLAVFVPAWDEAAVISDMLRNTVHKLDHPDYRIYVGCYPNDTATIAAVGSVEDARIRIVIGPVPGPTTKADCLNRLWDAMIECDRPVIPPREGRRDLVGFDGTYRAGNGGFSGLRPQRGL